MSITVPQGFQERQRRRYAKYSTLIQHCQYPNKVCLNYSVRVILIHHRATDNADALKSLMNPLMIGVRHQIHWFVALILLAPPIYYLALTPSYHPRFDKRSDNLLYAKSIIHHNKGISAIHKHSCDC